MNATEKVAGVPNVNVSVADSPGPSFTVINTKAEQFQNYHLHGFPVTETPLNLIPGTWLYIRGCADV